MKKVLVILGNAGIILLSFSVYSLLQTLYLLPSKFSSSRYWLEVILVAFATFLVIALMWLVYKKQLSISNPQNFNSKPYFSWKKFGIMTIGIIAMIAVQLLYSLTMGNQQPDNQVELNELLTKNNLVFKIMIAVVAPIIEEIIFRGFLVNGFFKANTIFSKVGAIVIGGLLFGLLHEPSFDPFLLVYWGMGVVLMSVYIFSKDLRYSMIVHIVNNTLSLL